MRSGGLFGSSWGRLRRAAGIGAAFVSEETDQRIHGRIMCAADQRCRLPLLGNEVGIDEPTQMMRQCRSGHIHAILHGANGQALVSGAHQEAIDAKPGRVAQRFELRRCFFEFHGNMNSDDDRRRQVVFREIWKKASGPPVRDRGFKGDPRLETTGKIENRGTEPFCPNFKRNETLKGSPAAYTALSV